MLREPSVHPLRRRARKGDPLTACSCSCFTTFHMPNIINAHSSVDSLNASVSAAILDVSEELRALSLSIRECWSV